MEVIDVQEGQLTRLVRTPHPLTVQGQTSVAVLQQDGETLAALLARHDVDEAWAVDVGGVPVPAIMWGRVRVRHGQVIECRRVVHDDVVRVFAFVVLAYFTMGAGNAALLGATGMTAGTFGAAMVGAAAFMAGSMLINRVLPPASATAMDMASNSAEPTYSLSGGRNSARLWQPMPLVLGEPYAVFDMAAQPYTYFSGEFQYLRQFFHLGVNCHKVTTLRIGQTALSSYTDVSIAAKGLAGNSYAASLPSANVDTIEGALLDAPTAPGAWVVRTSSAGVVRLGVDIEAALFGTNSSNGAWERRDLDVNVQYAVAGTGAWVNLDTKTGRDRTLYNSVPTGQVDYEGAPIYENVPYTVTDPSPMGTAWLSGASSKPVRLSIEWQVPAGQYDVRLRKLTANEVSTSAQNQVTWVALRSFQEDPAAYPGQSVLALTLKASGQLSGAVDEFNGILTAKPCPHWTGSAWATAATRDNGLANPGTILLAYARGHFDEAGRLMAGLGWPDSRINIESLKAFTVWCAARGFRFDAYLQDAMSHEDLIAAVAYAGLGTIDMADGRLGVQWLDPDQPVEGVINMGSIKARTFSVQYDTADRADEIEYGYFDRANGNSWTALRVLAPGVTMPRSTARLSNLGITSEAHAAVLARHAMAQNIYMAKAITFEQDLEFVTYRRGTVLALSHDLTQWGYSGRVQTVTSNAGVVTLGLDDDVPAVGAGGVATRFIGLRLRGEAQYRTFRVAAFAGKARSITLADPWPAGVPLPGSAGQVHDALWVYDFKATPGQKVVVSRIEPGESQSGARVTVVPLPDEFWPYVWTGAYTPPPNASQLTRTPSITSASVSEVLKRQGNTYSTDLVLSINPGEHTASVQVWGAAGGELLRQLGQTATGSFTWVGGLSELWNIKLIPFNSLGQPGQAYSLAYQVQGLSIPPSAVVGLGLRLEGNGVRVVWNPCVDVDYAETILKVGASWATATVVERASASTYLLPWQAFGALTVWAAHVDTTGNVGAPVSAAITIAKPAAPTGLAITVGNTGLRAAWVMPALVSTAQPVDRVELSWSSDFAAIVDAKKATSATFDWRGAGTHVLYARAVDVAGNVGDAVNASITVAMPGAVTGLALSAGNTGLQAVWAMPALAALAQPVDRVELSWSSNFASVIDAKRATAASFGWRAPGLVELFVRVVDVFGNTGTVASASLTVRAPSAPTGLAVAIGNTGARATWSAPAVAADQQPLTGVQLSWLADFSQLIEARTATSVDLGWLSAGSRTLYARYVDAAGNTGAAASAAFAVAAPSAPTGLAIGFGTASVEAKWNAPTVGASQQALDRVELSWAADFANVIDGKKATTTTFGWLTAGQYTLYARYVDVSGNVGGVSQTSLLVQAPAQPSMTAVETQVNAVTLRWQDAKTSQPIRKYAIYYGEAGTAIGAAMLYGSAGADSRSDVLFYRSSGQKVAYLVAEDVAGNLSVPRQIDLRITMPNDFVLASEYYEDWQSTELTNATIVGGPTGQIMLPAVDGRTWSQRLSNNGWTTAQQKVDASYPVVIQPVPASGKHVERKDIGKVLAAGVVRVTPIVQSSVAGYTATVRIRASNGDTDAAWQDWLVGESASFAAFRYVEVEYSVASDGHGFVVLDDLAVKVEVSEVTESGTLVLSAGDAAGTPFTTTKPFLDVRGAQATPLGSPNIARVNCIVDDAVSPAKVYVQAWDTSNNRTSGTVSLYISGV